MKAKNEIVTSSCAVFGAVCTTSIFFVCLRIYNSGTPYCGMGKVPNFGVYEPKEIAIFWLPFLSLWLWTMQFGALVATGAITIARIDVESLRIGQNFRSNSDYAASISILLCVAMLIMLGIRVTTLLHC